MYNNEVLKIFENPKNSGTLKGANGIGKVGNVQCGDIMKMYIRVVNDVIEDAKFKTFGCVSAIASSDVTCDLVKGKTVDQALKITNRDVLDRLGGLPPIKIHCSILAQEAIEAAVKDYRKRIARASGKSTVVKSKTGGKTAVAKSSGSVSSSKYQVKSTSSYSSSSFKVTTEK